MIFSNEILIRVAIVVLSVFGFWVAKHIRKHKVENKVLTCPVGFDCHAVVHSDYSTFLGIHLEVLGMIYYAFSAVAYTFVILLAKVLPVITADILALVSLIALLFSVYLIAVQIFILKKGCSWCIVSAFVSSSIFILALF